MAAAGAVTTPSAEPKSGRWNYGRDWDGIGRVWCDEATAEECTREALRMVFEVEDLTFTQVMDALAPKYFLDKRAMTFLDNKGREYINFSYGDVIEQTKRIAAYLQREAGLRPGDRAILLYPPGHEFILSILACYRAGVVPVPVYPPHPYRLETDVPRLNKIVENSGSKVALTDSQYLLVIRGISVKNVLSRVGLTTAIKWPDLRNVATDKVRASYTETELLEVPHPKGSDISFLQYTSGSTSDPKGVMVTWSNVKAQMTIILFICRDLYGFTNNNTGLSWLPQYHDMGLIGFFLSVLCCGGHLIYMTPITFLQDPTLWLESVSKYRAEVTAAPAFAFALAHRKTSESQLDKLDLSCLKMVLCGAEPIRVDPMRAFESYFAKAGYNPKALIPSYGLAEYTLCATSAPPLTGMTVLYVDQHTLSSTGRAVIVEEGAPGAVAYVSVGTVLPDDKGYPYGALRVVDRETRTALPNGVVGEVWLDGPSKTSGYFCDEEKTAASFHGILEGDVNPDRRWLQTGDMGFIHEGELYFTGRIKDIIIVRGRNIYPQDLEGCAEEAARDVLRPGCSGAFAVETANGEESVAYVAEINQNVDRSEANLQRTVETIRRKIIESFQVQVTAVVLVEPRTIPKTTSGKIQRYRCRDGYFHNKLKTVYLWEDTANRPADDDASVGSDDEYQDAVGLPFDAFPGSLTDDDESMPLEPADGEGPAAGLAAAAAAAKSPAEQEDEARKTSEYIDRIVAYVVMHRNIPREKVDIDEPMTVFGFDSVGFVALGKIMGDWVGKDIPPMIVYKYTTIREVAGFLARGAQECELLGDAFDEHIIERDMDAPIAIVGMSCKTAGGMLKGNLQGKDALWQFVMEGGNATRDDFPPERKSVTGSNLPGCYINGIDQFDAAFFGLSPSEASQMDWRQCILLEETWHACEDAGIDPMSLSGKNVGIYVGISETHEFAVSMALRREENTFSLVGQATSILANRISYLMNLHGPSVVVDTACSSSLVAVHDAVRDLRMGACSMAVAGGVSLILSAAASMGLQRAGFLSNACRTFDENANGYCRGEGCGMVVLKRLDRAVADGDRIYAVIRGAAVDHGGRTAGLTAPNPVAQELAFKAALRDAKVDAKLLTYIEPHGTGTRLGDTVEMAGLEAVMAGRDLSSRCLITSIKSNIGHTEGAAGVMGLMRAALVLHHGIVPRAVNFDTPNPLIPWERLPFDVPRVNTPLPYLPGHETAFAAVCSFGFGGTNGDVILESMPRGNNDVVELPVPTAITQALAPLILTISARSEGALQRLAQSYMDLLDSKEMQTSYDSVLDLCATVASQRSNHRGYRLAAVGRSAEQLKQSIQDQLASSDSLKGLGSTSQELDVVLLCTGQGAAYYGMGGELYERNPIFRAYVDECDAFFSPLLGLSIVSKVFKALLSTEVMPTLLAQPALFAYEYAMSQVWSTVGIRAVAVMGHSVGEVVAAVVAGCMSLEAGSKLICARAKALDDLPRGQGGMTVVFAEREVVESMIADLPLEIAAFNDTSCINVAGPLSALEELHSKLREQAIRFKALAVSHAFHSSAMEPALGPLREAIEGLETQAPKGTRLYSLVTGAQLTDAPGAQHWVDNVRQPVLFLQGMQTLAKDFDKKPLVFIELGPEPALTSMGRKIMSSSSSPVVWVPSMTNAGRTDENKRITEAFGMAFKAGVTLRLDVLRGANHGPRRVMDLPLYPFEQTVYCPAEEMRDAVMDYMNNDSGPRKSSNRGGSWEEQDYGYTYLLEEAWFPRVVEATKMGAMQLPPVHVVYVCSEAADAEAIAATHSMKRRSHSIILPQDDDAEAYTETIRKALEGHQSVGVVYVTSASGCTMGQQDVPKLSEMAMTENARLLVLLQVLAVLKRGEKMRLWVVTTAAKKVIPSDGVMTMNGAVYGMTKSALQEGYPYTWAVLLDLPAPSARDPLLLPSSAASVTPQEALAAANRFVSIMDREMVTYAPGAQAECLALRGGAFKVMRMRPGELESELDPNALRISQAVPDIFPPPGLDMHFEQTLATPEGEEPGWFLLTGGVGGLGLQCAFALARHGAKRFILTSRRGRVPPEYQADYETLCGMGTEVRVVACDAGKRDACFKIFEEFVIDGVVHCAGILDDGRLSAQNKSKLKNIWQGKVDGAVNLYDAVVRQGRPIKTFMLFSSSSGFLGSAGQATYASANSALDHLAQWARNQGMPATSIQWGVWVNTGFAGDHFIALLNEVGNMSITKSLGGAVMTALFNRTAADCPILTCPNPYDWSRFVKLGPEYMLSCDLSCFEPVKARVARSREAGPVLSEELKQYASLPTAEERKKMVQDVMIETIAKAAGKDVKPEDNLQDVGIQSLEAVDLMETLRSRLPIKMELARLVEYQTVEALCSFIQGRLDLTLENLRLQPLSRGQQTLVKSGMKDSFLFIELHLPAGAPVALKNLMSAWSTLLTRHSALRTVFHFSEEAKADGKQVAGRQQVLRPLDVPMSEIVGSLPDTGAAKELSSLERALKDAAERMMFVPPVRLFVIEGLAPTIFMAASRMLLDRWSVRLMAGELMALYKSGSSADVVSAQLQKSFMEQSVQEEAKAAPVPEKPMEIEPLPFIRERPDSTSMLRSGAGDEVVIELPRSLADQVEVEAIKSGTSPAAVLLSAYAVALARYGRNPDTSAKGMSVVVELDKIYGPVGVLGPVLVPFVMHIDGLAEQGSRLRRLCVQVEKEITLAAQRLLVADDKDVAPLTDSLPGFSYEERWAGVEISTHGKAGNSQALELRVISLAAGDGTPTRYELRLQVAQNYFVPNVDEVMDSVLEALQLVVLGQNKSLSGLLGTSSNARGLLRSGSSTSSLTKAKAKSAPVPPALHEPLSYPLAALIQLVGMGVIGSIGILAVLLVWPLVVLAAEQFGPIGALCFCGLAYHLIGLFTLGCVIFWQFALMRGWNEAVECSVYSTPYLRWWFVTRLESFLAPMYLDHMRGTHLYTFYLRLRGAKIGNNVRISAGAAITDPELITLNDGAVVGKARLVTSIVRDGTLYRSPVVVGRCANVGTGSVMLLGSSLGDGSALRSLSVATEGQKLAENGVFEGAPAHFVRHRDLSFAAQVTRSWGGFVADAFIELFHAFLGPSLTVITSALAFWAITAIVDSAGLFPWFSTYNWKQGPLVLFLYCALGVTPMLGMPTMLVLMHFTANAGLLPAKVWATMGLAGVPDLSTAAAIQAAAQQLPSWASLSGSPGAVQLVLPPIQGLTSLVLPALGLPSAHWFHLAIVAMLGVAMLLQQILLALATMVWYYILLAPTSSVRPRRVNGLKSGIRQIKVSILNWTNTRVIRFLSGTEAVSMWYWMLGAEVGRGVVMSTDRVVEDPHLVTMGNGVIIGESALLETVEEPGNGYTSSGRVTLGDNVVLGGRCVLNPGATLPNGAMVLSQSSVASTYAVTPNSVVMGVPGVRVLDRSVISKIAPGIDVYSGTKSFVALRLFFGYALAPFLSWSFNNMMPLMTTYPVLFFLFWLLNDGWQVNMTQLWLPVIFVSFVAMLLILLVVVRGVSRYRQREGSVLGHYSPSYQVRVSAVTLQSYMTTLGLDVLCGSVFAPLALNILGGKVHLSAYINTLKVTEPHLIKVDKRASLEQDALVVPVVFEDEGLRLKTVEVAAAGRLGVGSTVMGGAVVQYQGEVAEAALLPPDSSLRPGGVCYGTSLAAAALSDGDEETGAARGNGMVMLTIKV